MSNPAFFTKATPAIVAITALVLQNLSLNAQRQNDELSIRKISVSVSVEADSLYFTLGYKIENTSKADLKIDTLDFVALHYLVDEPEAYLKKFYSSIIASNSTREFVIEGSQKLNKKNLKKLILDPSLSINNKLFKGIVDTVSYYINLSRTVVKRITFISDSSIKVTSETQGYLCTLVKNRVKPDQIKIGISSIEAKFDLTKKIKINPVSKYALVTVILVNLTNQTFNSLSLEDRLFPADILPISPKSEFIDYMGVENDRMIIWVKQIKTLKPKEKMLFTYQIKLRRNVREFREVYLLLDSQVVATSTRVKGMTLITPPLKYSFAVVPTSWAFDFTDDDHHIDYIKTQVKNVTNEGSSLKWTSEVRYSDKNSDDDYKWRINHTILRLPSSFTFTGNSGSISDNGGSSSHQKSYQSENLKKFDNATVILVAWSLNFADDDHEIKKVKIGLTSISFDREDGKITWTASANYEDNNHDDDYSWSYSYCIVGFNNGVIKRKTRSGTRAKRNLTDVTQMTDDDLKGYKTAIVIPRGYSFNFRGDEHHINEIGFSLATNSYDPADGKVVWSASMVYSDKNFDDEFDWSYNVDIIALNQGEYREFDTGTITDNGGASEKDYNKQVDVLFSPVTWFDYTMNGTETGVDCDGNSPFDCMTCVLDNVDKGSAEDADLFSLSSSVVEATAIQALKDYAAEQGEDYNSYYSDFNKADRYVEAVAWYVDKNMDWIKDEGDWEGAQKAKRTITNSGSRRDGPYLYYGDCEDHSILRTALLRSLGFSANCILSARNDPDNDQGQFQECRDCDKKSGHVYNLVYYQGRYRIMDYNDLDYYFLYSECWCPHSTDNIFNDHYGSYDGGNKRVNGKLLINYPGGGPDCPGINWNWRTFYIDVCR